VPLVQVGPTYGFPCTVINWASLAVTDRSSKVIQLAAVGAWFDAIIKTEDDPYNAYKRIEKIEMNDAFREEIAKPPVLDRSSSKKHTHTMTGSLPESIRYSISAEERKIIKPKIKYLKLDKGSYLFQISARKNKIKYITIYYGIFVGQNNCLIFCCDQGERRIPKAIFLTFLETEIYFLNEKGSEFFYAHLFKVILFTKSSSSVHASQGSGTSNPEQPGPSSMSSEELTYADVLDWNTMTASLPDSDPGAALPDLTGEVLPWTR